MRVIHEAWGSSSDAPSSAAVGLAMASGVRIGELRIACHPSVGIINSSYATHGTWAAVFLYLMVHGPGRLSLDHWIARHRGAAL